MEKYAVNTYYQGQGCIQIIIIETHMFKMYCKAQGVYRSSSWRHIWSWRIAKSKGIYSSSWRHGQDILPRPRCIQIIIRETHTFKTYCWGQGYIQIIMETQNSHDILPRPRYIQIIIMETHTFKTYCQGQGYIQIIMETRTVKTHCWGQGYIQIISMETCMVKTYCQVQGYIQIIMETQTVTTYCQDQGYIQIVIIMETSMGQDVLLYIDYHHRGDKYGQDVLPRPRLYTDHHGFMYRWSGIAQAKGIYKVVQIWPGLICTNVHTNQSRSYLNHLVHAVNFMYIIYIYIYIYIHTHTHTHTYIFYFAVTLCHLM